jgi:hypothetical protein
MLLQPDQALAPALTSGSKATLSSGKRNRAPAMGL